MVAGQDKRGEVGRAGAWDERKERLGEQKGLKVGRTGGVGDRRRERREDGRKGVRGQQTRGGDERAAGLEGKGW